MTKLCKKVNEGLSELAGCLEAVHASYIQNKTIEALEKDSTNEKLIPAERVKAAQSILKAIE